MGDHRLDFHSTFRRLAYFRPSMARPVEGSAGENPALDQFVRSILSLTPEPEMVDALKATSDLKAWLKTYAVRIESERAEWESEGGIDAAREHAMRAANPRFVLRQWVLEEVIKKVEDDYDTGKRILAKVLQVCFFDVSFVVSVLNVPLDGMLSLRTLGRGGRPGSGRIARP